MTGEIFLIAILFLFIIMLVIPVGIGFIFLLGTLIEFFDNERKK